MTLEAREDLAEAMVPFAMRMVGAVHDDGPGAVTEVLSEVHPDNLPALVVVLAAMVDPTKTPGYLLRWLNDGPALFDTDPYILDTVSPRDWSDTVCHRLWREYRRVSEPGSDWLHQKRQAGYREWERRRKDRQRKGLPVARSEP